MQESISSKFYKLMGNVRTLNIGVGIIFFFVWCNLAIEVLICLPEILFFLIGFGLPIVLLIGVVQFKSITAYLLVVSIFIIDIIVNVLSLPYYVQELINEYFGKYSSCSCCPIGEIQDQFLMIFISLIAISLMHNRRMVETYQWKAIFFYKTVLVVYLLFLIVYLMQAWIAS